MENTTLFQKLENILIEQERSAKDIETVKQAFDLANEYHNGQIRASEEPYIIHPLEVACILADLQSDMETITAALLHDLLEDTTASPEIIKDKFGESVFNLVDSVTKLSKYSFSSKEQRQAENFRKMFLAMANDIRVILLKLADRLHNMRTLKFMTPVKQKKIAQETLEIFSPLANRLGMGKLKAELDDLCLLYLHQDVYKEIEHNLEESEKERDKVVQLSTKKIENLLHEVELNGSVQGRAKNYYSIYKKMSNENKSFLELFDISAVRVIVDAEKECYEVLGIIHSAFKPIPGRFKDYIAMPKSNLYRSLHTTVIGPNGKPLEVQIRTTDMHMVAEYGIAAHWKYKEGNNTQSSNKEIDKKFLWLRKLVEFQQDVKDAREYVDSVKLDLFRDEVFVFTPKGDVHDLPSGAVPIDFAYRVHTEVGHTCTGALINGKIVPLDTVLKNGDIIEIITSKNSHPRLDWLNIVATNTAKGRIRAWFKKNRRDEHIIQGKSLLESELTKAKVDEIIKSGKLLEIANQLNQNTIEDLFATIGYGELNISKVVSKLKKEEKDPESVIVKPRYASGKFDKTGKNIEGLDGMMHHISKCCFPLPGENIVGVITRSRGISIHREDCKSLSSVSPERIMNITWSEKSEVENAKSYPVSFIIEVIDRIGVFKDILSKVADKHINVTYAGVKTKLDNTAIIEISVDVSSKNQYENLIKTLYDLSDVINIKRQQLGTTIHTKPQKKSIKSKKFKHKH